MELTCVDHHLIIDVNILKLMLLLTAEMYNQ
jgi:hypothetical protein